jgi:intraflagellar transport protein 172
MRATVMKYVTVMYRSFPGEVVRLEEAWGDWLVQQKQVDMAINHYIEGRANSKAIEAALNSRQWTKAAQLVDTVDKHTAKQYYKRLAR